MTRCPQLRILGIIITVAACLGVGERRAVFADAPSPTATGATLVGKVLFTGDKPKRRVINTAIDPACQGHAGEPLLSEVVIVNPNETLRNVLVYVKEGLPPEKKYDVPKTAVVVDQVNCHYQPHVFGARVGQPVLIRNGDNTLHNIHGRPKINKEFNVAQAIQGMEETVVFKRPESPFPIKCDVHVWMTAWCAVFDHPFFAVTGDDGTFSIPDLPPGDYTIETWHERYGTRELKVHLDAGEKKEIQFTFEAKKPS